jgi:O-antigen ligase
LIAMPLLLLLVGTLLWFRVGTIWSLGIFAVATGLFLTAAAAVFARDPHLWATSWEYLTGDPDLVQRESAASLRYDLWRAAIRLIPEQPLFGHGLSSMPEVLLHPVADVPEGSVLLNFGHMHNEYLDTLLKTGIAGFVLFYAPMLLALWLAWRRFADPAGRVWALAAAWVVGAQLIYGMTSVMFAHGVTVLQFGVYLGMLMFIVTPDGSKTAHNQA